MTETTILKYKLPTVLPDEGTQDEATTNNSSQTLYNKTFDLTTTRILPPTITLGERVVLRWNNGGAEENKFWTETQSQANYYKILTVQVLFSRFGSYDLYYTSVYVVMSLDPSVTTLSSSDQYIQLTWKTGSGVPYHDTHSTTEHMTCTHHPAQIGAVGNGYIGATAVNLRFKLVDLSSRPSFHFCNMYFGGAPL